MYLYKMFPGHCGFGESERKQIWELTNQVSIKMYTKMKKHCFFPAMALMLATAVFTFPGCTGEEGPEMPDPVLTITTEGPVTADAAGGGDYSIGYSLENPVEGGAISFEAVYPDGADSDWITFDEEQTEGKITFSIGENENTEAGRTATIKVTYSYGDGMTVSDDLEVSQAAADVPLPAIEITDLGEDGKVHVEGNATELGMIFVSVKNAEGLEGSLSGETEAGWISDIRPMADASNGLVFTVTDNYEGSERTATITVNYSWDGGKVSAPVEIVQDTKPLPVIEVTNQGEDGKVHVQGQATEYAMVFVEVANAEGLDGAVTGTSDAGWISNIRSMNTKDAGILFAVSDNNEGRERTATITLYYSWGEHQVSAEVEIVQDVIPAVLPEIEVTGLGDDGKIHVAGEATEYASVSVSITNAEGLDGIVTGISDAGWITNIRSMYKKDAGVLFNVTDNYEGSERSATITLTYSWDGGQVSKDVEIVQDALPVATAVYKGNNEFWLTIPVSEDEFFFFDLFTTDTDGTSIPVNPDSMGRYFIYNETTGTGFVEGNSYYSASGEKTILEYGFIEIKYSGNDIVISGTVGNNSSDIGATPNYTGPVSITSD